MEKWRVTWETIASKNICENSEETYLDRVSRLVVGESNKLWVNKEQGTFLGTLPDPDTSSFNEDTAIADQTSLLLFISEADYISLHRREPNLVRVLVDM